MTDKQPEALRLADRLDLYATGDEHQRDTEEAAAELRRQHAELETLRMGYAAARLEIESLRAAQPAGAQQPGAAYSALPDEREAFEAMMRSQTFDSLKRLSDGSYESYEARVGWLAWNVRASHGQAPAGESLRTDALCDLSYSHGLKAGWNYCASDDLAGFERAQKIGIEALRAIKSTTAQAAPAARITLDFKQAAELLEMFGGEPCEITLTNGEGRTGKGLYAYYTDLPEEGAIYLGVSDDDARPAAAPAAVAGCTRSHPHENMDSSCRAKTAIAEMQNMAARGAEATAQDLERFVRMLAAAPSPTTQPAHPDYAAVDALAAHMKAKLAKQRAKGYGGWDDPGCSQQRLSDMLRDHVAKGDPVDVANFCAFLTARGEGIAPPAPQQEPSHTAVQLAEMVLSDCGHSSRYAPLLNRVTARINAHVERRLDELRGCLESRPLPAAQVDAALTQAARDVLAERQRQISAEGYDADHDDAHVNDEIAAMAALFVMPPGAREWDASSTSYGDTLAEAILPQDWEMPALGDRRRELVSGAAMALAELERIDRADAARAAQEGK